MFKYRNSRIFFLECSGESAVSKHLTQLETSKTKARRERLSGVSFSNITAHLFDESKNNSIFWGKKIKKNKCPPKKLVLANNECLKNIVCIVQ